MAPAFPPLFRPLPVPSPLDFRVSFLCGSVLHVFGFSWFVGQSRYSVLGFLVIIFPLIISLFSFSLFRHVRSGCCDACGFANWRFPLKLVVGKTFPAFLAHAQPAILRIWEEAHERSFNAITMMEDTVWYEQSRNAIKISTCLFSSNRKRNHETIRGGFVQDARQLWWRHQMETF